MNAPRYGRTAVLLHWLHAVLVLGLLAAGWIMADMPKGPDRSALIALHKSFGLCALALIAARSWWRLRHPPADTHADGWTERLAAATHRALYALLFLAPLFGYLSASFTKYPMKFFGIVIPRAGWPDEAVNAVFNGLHKTTVWTLAALIALHLAGALYHALRRDGAVAGMLPKCLAGGRQ